MKYHLKENDYLKLWQYFEDKASSVKKAMFTTVTWLIGFTAALLGFMFVKLADFNPENAWVKLPTLMLFTAISGLSICLYALITIAEGAKHIKNNWNYANCCLKNIPELKDKIIFKETKKKNNKNPEPIMNKIWNQLRIVVFLFIIAFLFILIWSFFIKKGV